MLDMGFLPDIQRILELLPQQRQNLMFSATFSDDIRRLSGDDPARPGDGRGRAAQHDRRGGPPARLPGRSRPQGGAARAPDPPGRPAPGPRLHPDQAGGHHGWRPGSTARASMPSPSTRDRSQPERTRALEGFKTGEIRVLVATDVAARGLDIEDLPVVVNFELPWNPQDYIHRIGRTGPGGRDRARPSRSSASTRSTCCAASSGCSSTAIPWTVEEGFVPDRNAEPRPLGMRSRARPGRAASTTPTESRSADGRRRQRRRVGGRAAGLDRSAGLGRRPAAGADGRAPARSCRADRGAREEEAEHDVGLDPLDAVAVDERVLADGHRPPPAGRATDRRTSRSRTNSPVGPRQRPTRVEAGQGRQLALDDVRARPRARSACQAAWTGMRRFVVGDREEDVVDGDRHVAGGRGPRASSSACQLHAVRAASRPSPRGPRAGARRARGCRWPSPRWCRHRHGSASVAPAAWAHAAPS